MREKLILTFIWLSLQVTFLTLLSFFVNKASCTLVQAIRDVLQYNVAGIPLTHEEVKMEFDPEVSKKRRELYYEVSYCPSISIPIQDSHTSNFPASWLSWRKVNRTHRLRDRWQPQRTTGTTESPR